MGDGGVTTFIGRHVLRLRMDAPGVFEPAINASIMCTAGDDAPCHISCSAGCESWEAEGHEHELAGGPECLAVTWIENEDEGVVSCYGGPDGMAIGTGNRVVVFWDGERWLWRRETRLTQLTSVRRHDRPVFYRLGADEFSEARFGSFEETKVAAAKLAVGQYDVLAVYADELEPVQHVGYVKNVEVPV
jgi:hypothetical protein